MSIQSAIEALRNHFGDQVSTAEAIRDQHGQNESYFAVTLPDAVVFPTCTADVQKIVRMCSDHACPIVPWGVGTSLEGNALATQGGISLDLSQMAKVLSVNADDMDAVVQPGVTREALNEELRATGLFFPVDPGANATLGGMAATRASGTTAVRYGTMRENVLAMEVVLADGRAIRVGSRARKSSAGYDLAKLMIGSEGTLGIITELTVRLQGQPEAISAATCKFDDVRAAVEAVQATIQMGIPMARIEFVDEDCVRGFNAYANTELLEKPHLFLEFHGTEAGVAEQAQTVGEVLAEYGGAGFEWATKAEDRNRLWHVRHNGYYAVKGLRPGCQAVTTDVCVPISRLADAIEATRADIAASPIEGPILGHVGDGNYHAALLIAPGDAKELAVAKDLAHRMNARALEMGGTVTGEHGVGLGKKRYMAEEHGEAWQVMAAIKRTLDPQNILNPGKVVELN
ncbi:MAG: FAD-linked oxidase C-terminal domain-containing protein [Pseudomonadota bacterium]